MTQPLTHWPAYGELPLKPGVILHVRDRWETHRMRIDEVQPGFGGDWAYCRDEKSGLLVKVFCMGTLAQGSHPRLT